MELELKAERARLNSLVAVTVALLSVAMAVGNIKNNNTVQQMTFAKATSVDIWNEYQATRIKLHTNEVAIGQIGLGLDNPAARAAEVVNLQKKVGKYTDESTELMTKAKGEDARYRALNIRHDQFDVAEALDSIAIALAAVAALTDIFWLLCGGWAFGALGIITAISGFAGITLYPEFLARALG